MTCPSSILIIDDDEGLCEICHHVLTREGYQVRTADDGFRGLDILKRESYDLIILDLKMPGMPGEKVLEEIKKSDPEATVIVITGYPTVESAVDSMKNGAYDFLPKPFSHESLRLIVKRAIERRMLALEKILLVRESGMERENDIIVGKSPAIKKVVALVKKAALTDSTVLISGESGTGKERVSRAIHHYSYRKEKPFVPVDCGTATQTLFESELFGHVRGAFPGALATKYGRFELANGGTIFFDEIGNIGSDMQGELLRVLQDKEITRMGSSQVVKINVRVIAATNGDLHKAVREGSFREDLFHRLNVISIDLPPLRERKEDIPLFARYFLKKHAGMNKNRLPLFSDRSIESLIQYPWPGNVRELENSVKRAVTLAEGDIIGYEDLFFPEQPVESPDALRDNMTLEEVEKDHIRKTLRSFGGNLGKAAGALGIGRSTLRRKIEKYRLP